MSANLFLFGTDHKFQCGGYDCTVEQAASFSEALSSACFNYSIRRIAEEMTEDGRINYGVKETIASRVAHSMSIAHQDVDINKTERAALSLTDSAVINAKLPFGSRDGGSRLRAKFDLMVAQTRERIWAARLMNSSAWPALFILGADHVDSFHLIWRRLGGSVYVVHKNYIP